MSEEKKEYDLMVDEFNQKNSELMKLKLEIDKVKSEQLIPLLEEEYKDKYFKFTSQSWVKYVHIKEVKSVYEFNGDVIQLVVADRSEFNNSTVIVANANIDKKELDIEENQKIGVEITETDEYTFKDIALKSVMEIVGTNTDVE